MESYSFNIQRQLASNTVVQVGYIGNRGVKLFMNEDVNQPRIYTNGFLQDFQQMQAFVANSSTAVPAGNVFVRIYGSPQAAVSALQASNFSQGRVGTVLNTMDRTLHPLCSRRHPRYLLPQLPSVQPGRRRHQRRPLLLRFDAGQHSSHRRRFATRRQLHVEQEHG